MGLAVRRATFVERPRTSGFHLWYLRAVMLWRNSALKENNSVFFSGVVDLHDHCMTAEVLEIHHPAELKSNTPDPGHKGPQGCLNITGRCVASELSRVEDLQDGAVPT